MHSVICTTLKCSIPGEETRVKWLCNCVILFIRHSQIYPGEGKRNPLQYFCLENPMDRGAWWVHRVAKSRTRLSDFTHSLTQIYAKF